MLSHRLLCAAIQCFRGSAYKVAQLPPTDPAWFVVSAIRLSTTLAIALLRLLKSVLPFRCVNYVYSLLLWLVVAARS